MFTLENAATISQLDGWMRVRQAGILTVSVFSVSASTGLPDVELFTASAALAQNTTPAWRGVSGLNWTFDAGSYWAIFGAPDGDTFYGSMPRDPPNPLTKYAFTSSGVWTTSEFVSRAGIRLSGEYGAPFALKLATFEVAG
jgi:hypothetical protein